MQARGPDGRTGLTGHMNRATAEGKQRHEGRHETQEGVAAPADKPPAVEPVPRDHTCSIGHARLYLEARSGGSWPVADLERPRIRGMPAEREHLVALATDPAVAVGAPGGGEKGVLEGALQVDHVPDRSRPTRRNPRRSVRWSRERVGCAPPGTTADAAGPAGAGGVCRRRTPASECGNRGRVPTLTRTSDEKGGPGAEPAGERDLAVPPPARGQPGGLVGVGRRRRSRRRGGATCRCCSSVGYAACHWCHVMAHESFEDEATAAYLNEHFVSIKVDREERPDVDAVYMEATTAMTGHGGWPMTCVLDHDGDPFFAGTYFPDQPRHGQPAFRQVLEALVGRVGDRRDDVRRVARQPREHLGQASGAGRRARSTERGARRRRWRRWRGSSTATAAASAAPRSSRRRWCWSSCSGTPRGPATPTRCRCRTRPSRRWRAAASTTSSAAASRATPSTRGWVVPHFEKMLYDNAQLLGVYARWWRRPAARPSGSPARPPTSCSASCAPTEGGFASALDADTRGRRGHVLRLDARRSSSRCSARTTAPGRRRLFEVTEAGTFEHGASTLQLLADPERPGARLADVRPRRLLAARATRTRPARDDKVVAAWNGLAIAGAVPRPGCCSSEPTYVDAAVAAARLLRRVHTVDGRAAPGLARRRSWAGTPACSRTTAASRTASSRCSARPGTRSGCERARILLDDALERVPGRRRRLLRHRRRRRGAGRPAAGPLRQRQPVGPVRDWCTRWSTYAALTGSGRHRDAAEEALRHGAHAGRAGAPVRRLVAGRRRGEPDGPARGRGRRRRPATRTATPWPGRAAARPGGRRGGRAADGRPRRRPVPLLAGRGAGRRPRRGVRLPRDGLRAAGHRRRPTSTALLRGDLSAGSTSRSRRRRSGRRTPRS